MWTRPFIEQMFFLWAQSASVDWICLFSGNNYVFLVKEQLFPLHSGVMTSFVNVVIIKIVNSSGLTETMVHYQICQLNSNLHSSWKLHSLLACEQRHLHSARSARVCLQEPDHFLDWMLVHFQPGYNTHDML